MHEKEIDSSAAGCVTAGAETSGKSSVGVKLLYTKKEAAEMLSVSERTIENLLANKELAARRIGRRVLIAHQTLVQFSRRDHPTQ
jgi:excisionase family DNA binding protein